ncbi:MAG TPA: hypothetical protein VFG35_14505 [Actinoplanes sp.]|nr:hypothetical protein [Actinoplanes sp.]
MEDSTRRHSGRGGRRPSTVKAIFTAQIIGLVLPGTKTRVIDLCRRYGLSQSVVVRRCIDAGLPVVESALEAENPAA